MTGCIITGHGGFSEGMLSAVEMIAGSQEKMKAITFGDLGSLDDYSKKVEQAVMDFSDSGEEVVIFTDLKGGTPFNIAMLLREKIPNVYVFSGTNLPMLLEFTGYQLANAEVNQIAEDLIQIAGSGIALGEIKILEEEQEGDGI